MRRNRRPSILERRSGLGDQPQKTKREAPTERRLFHVRLELSRGGGSQPSRTLHTSSVRPLVRCRALCSRPGAAFPNIASTFKSREASSAIADLGETFVLSG